MLSLVTLASLWTTPQADESPLVEPAADAITYSVHSRSFNHTIARVEGMVSNPQVQAMAQEEGLSVVNVTWEDTGRSKGSSWGPNISDMTIGVRDPDGALHPMPVFRFDNFNDKTSDVRSENIFVRAGNAQGRELRSVSIPDVLKNTREYLHNPRSWKGELSSLWNERDAHVLVSAQACFLPIPQSGEATFTPVIYNYQSSKGNPAVLTIVATREGTSIQVVENDEGYLSEVLYFNQDGQRAPFTATRLSDFKASGGDATTSAADATEDAGLNVVLVIQVPLKHKVSPLRFSAPMDDMDAGFGSKSAESFPSSPRMESDVEQAVIGHGEVEGPFYEVNGLTIERDPRFPVRVTAQFYKATSNGVVSPQDVADIRSQIDKVYGSGDYVGSLVTGGNTSRPTEWAKPKQHGPWARPIWQWHKSQ